jgi:hypothetical protein
MPKPIDNPNRAATARERSCDFFTVSVNQAATGFRAHSGYAILVTVGGSVASPAVIQRRRIELVDRAISGSAQPYHAAQPMKLEEAKAFLERCADTTRAMACNAVQAAVAELAGQGYQTAGSCILSSSARALPELAAILASHPLIHTAEGEFFREALRLACESCSLPVLAVKERELLSRCAAALRISSVEVERKASSLGKNIGPPWRRDEKLCAVASWLVLAIAG